MENMKTREPANNNSFIITNPFFPGGAGCIRWDSVAHPEIGILNQYINPLVIFVFRINFIHKDGYHISVRFYLRRIGAHDIDADALEAGEAQRDVPRHGIQGLSPDAEEEIGLVEAPADQGRLPLRNPLFQHMLPELSVEGLQTQLHLQLKTGELLPEGGNPVAIEVVGFKMDGGDSLLAAYLPDQGQHPGIQLEDGAAVDDLQVAEPSGDIGQHLAVQDVIGLGVGTSVGVIVAESAFLIDTSAAAQENDFPLSFF